MPDPETSMFPKQQTLRRLILVYRADSGIKAVLLDVLKKAVGKEDCSLCEITYSPIGKRPAWRACEARLGLKVDELHANDVPGAWQIARADLPCILGQIASETPFVLVTSKEIDECEGRVDRLELAIERAIATRQVQKPASI